ncbi:nicotinate-nucleotide diphosphorylase (carboxylating), partial [Candidatus Latescibacterota bacterium]
EAIRDASNTNHKKILIEVSGNIDTENIKEIADTGVDYISIGSLTHSVVNHDFTLLFDEL